ncbi:hypothetical protein E4U42_000737, partial [Claviceps africana]
MFPTVLPCASFLSIGLGLALAVALALAAYPETLLFTPPLAPPSSSGPVANTSTYCYHGVRTHDRDNPSARCFAVAADGTFAR